MSGCETDSRPHQHAQFIASEYDEISKSPNPAADLAVKCAERIKEDMEQALSPDARRPVFLLSGVQIRADAAGPGETYFRPLSFSLRDADGRVHDLMPELRRLRDLDLAHAVAVLRFWHRGAERRVGALEAVGLGPSLVQ
jgi:hypothetical protein